LTEREGWTVNNTIKICEKRAQVDAVLRRVGLSEIFTQDIEDLDQRQALVAEQARPAAAPRAETPMDRPASAERPARLAPTAEAPAERPAPTPRSTPAPAPAA